MKRAKLDSILKKIESKTRRDWLKWAREAKSEETKARCLKRAEKALNSSLPISWGPKRGTFKLANLEFNPMTGEGRSYEWYAITRVIKGKLVLNTYRYSVTTSKHVSLLRRLLTTLGLKYVEIEAPNGLQNLDIAVQRQAELLAKCIINEKYARIKSKGSIKYFEKKLALCIALGGSSSKNLTDLVAYFERRRTERLEVARARRLKVVDNAPESDRNKQGIHLTRGVGERIGTHEMDSIREDAHKDGFKVIYIHRIATNGPTLRLVSNES